MASGEVSVVELAVFLMFVLMALGPCVAATGSLRGEEPESDGVEWSGDESRAGLLKQVRTLGGRVGRLRGMFRMRSSLRDAG